MSVLTRSAILAAALVILCQGPSPAEDPKVALTARGILDKVARTYSLCRTYSDEGTVTNEFTDPGGKSEKPEAADRFTTAFVRPDRFKFDFRHNGPSAAKQSVIWSEKDGPRNWWDLDRRVERPESLDFALGASAGVTMGASTEVPKLFLGSPIKTNPERLAAFSQWKDLKRLGDRKVDGIDCYQVEGRMEALDMRTTRPFQTRMTSDVDQATFLIRRVRTEMDLEIGKVVTTIRYKPKLDQPIDEKSLSFDPTTDAVKPK